MKHRRNRKPRTDLNDIPFDFYAIDLDRREIAKVCHEISSVYTKYQGKRYILHRTTDLEYNWCIYYVENRGFGDYNIIEKVYD